MRYASTPPSVGGASDAGAIIGEAALSERDRSYLRFAHVFEHGFVHQGGQRRSIEETLELAWELFAGYPKPT